MKKELEIIKTLSDPTRFRIFKMLQHRDAYVCEITYILKLTMATVSSHLSKMKSLNIVNFQRIGNKIKYSLNKSNEESKPILNFFSELGENWESTKNDRRILDSIELKEVCPSEEE